jgi:hypothetical protein
MTCHDCQERLQCWLDGDDLGDQADLEAHLRDCSTCRELHQAARQLRAAMRLITAPMPSTDLSRRITGQVLADSRRQARLRQRYVVLAMAASVLLTVVGGYIWLRQHTPSATENLAKNREVPSPTPAAPSLRDSVVEAGTAVVNLTRRTADGTVEPTRFLWSLPLPTAGLNDTVALEKTLEPPARSLREASQSVTQGLEPVTNSARRALDLFLRELAPPGSAKSGS